MWKNFIHRTSRYTEERGLAHNGLSTTMLRFCTHTGILADRPVTAKAAEGSTSSFTQVPTLTKSRAQLHDWICARESPASSCTTSTATASFSAAASSAVHKKDTASLTAQRLVSAVAALSVEGGDESLFTLLCTLASTLQADYNQTGKPDAVEALYGDVLEGIISSDSLAFAVTTLDNAIYRYAEALRNGERAEATSVDGDEIAKAAGLADASEKLGHGRRLTWTELKELRLTLECTRAWLDAQPKHSMPQAAYHIEEVYKIATTDARVLGDEGGCVLSEDRQRYWIAYSRHLTTVMYPVLKDDEPSAERYGENTRKAQEEPAEATMKGTLAAEYEGGNFGIRKKLDSICMVWLSYMKGTIASVGGLNALKAQEEQEKAAAAASKETNKKNVKGGDAGKAKKSATGTGSSAPKTPSATAQAPSDSTAARNKLWQTGLGICIIAVVAMADSFQNKSKESEKMDKGKKKEASCGGSGDDANVVTAKIKKKIDNTTAVHSLQSALEGSESDSKK